MRTRSWLPIALFLLISFPLAAQKMPEPAPDRKDDCPKACAKAADKCYGKCESDLRSCRSRARAKCTAKFKDDPKAKESCIQEGNRECADEKSIHCDGQCSAKRLECTKDCDKKKPRS